MPTQPPIRHSYWTSVFFPPRVEDSGPEVDRSPQSGNEVKKKWSRTASHPVCLHGLEKEAALLFFLLCHRLVESDVRT